MNEAAATLQGEGEVAQSSPRYPPIRDYAAIGDCHGCALVSRDGSIDWCALRRFDADPVLCRNEHVCSKGKSRSSYPQGTVVGGLEAL